VPSIALALAHAGQNRYEKKTPRPKCSWEFWCEELRGLAVLGKARTIAAQETSWHWRGAAQRYKARCYCRSFFHERVGVGFLMCCGAITMLEKYGAVVAVENKGLNSKSRALFPYHGGFEWRPRRGRSEAPCTSLPQLDGPFFLVQKLV